MKSSSKQTRKLIGGRLGMGRGQRLGANVLALEVLPNLGTNTLRRLRPGLPFRPSIGTLIAAQSIGLLGLLAGCTLGPEAQRPQNVAQHSERFVHAEASERGQLPKLKRWWRRFDDPVTNQLVQTALKRNTDLRQAAARVEQAQAVVGQARGQRWPEIDVGFSGRREQSTFNFGGGRDSATTTTWTADGMIAWQADIFGRLRRQEEAEWYRLLATEADRAAVLHSVVAQVVRLRTQIATFQQQLRIARSRAESFKQTLDLIQQRFDQDLSNQLEVRSARENLEQSRAQIPSIVADIETTRHALDVLLGRAPGTGKPLSQTLSPVPEEQSPPVGVPASLLDNRPDLRTTALRARAEQAEVGVAIAQLFPDLTLGASGGYQASELENLFDPQSEIWSILLDAAMPILHGGELRANIDQAKAQAKAMAAQYAGDVLTAMREVEDALIQQQTTWQRYRHLVQQVQEVRASLKLARQRYQQGLESLLDVLDVQRRRFNAELARASAQQALWNRRIDLYLALGGQWVESKDPDAEQTQGDRSEDASANPTTQPPTDAEASDPGNAPTDANQEKSKP